MSRENVGFFFCKFVKKNNFSFKIVQYFPLSFLKKQFKTKSTKLFDKFADILLMLQHPQETTLKATQILGNDFFILRRHEKNWLLELFPSSYHFLIFILLSLTALKKKSRMKRAKYAVQMDYHKSFPSLSFQSHWQSTGEVMTLKNSF